MQKTPGTGSVVSSVRKRAPLFSWRRTTSLIVERLRSTTKKASTKIEGGLVFHYEHQNLCLREKKGLIVNGLLLRAGRGRKEKRLPEIISGQKYVTWRNFRWGRAGPGHKSDSRGGRTGGHIELSQGPDREARTRSYKNYYTQGRRAC